MLTWLVRRSTTRYLFKIVSWKSNRQPTVALSNAESEYMALSAACQEGIWLRRIFKSFSSDQKSPTIIFEDNQGCIALANNPVAHDRTKQFDIRYHFTIELIDLKGR